MCMCPCCICVFACEYLRLGREPVVRARVVAIQTHIRCLDIVPVLSELIKLDAILGKRWLGVRGGTLVPEYESQRHASDQEPTISVRGRELGCGLDLESLYHASLHMHRSGGLCDAVLWVIGVTIQG